MSVWWLWSLLSVGHQTGLSARVKVLGVLSHRDRVRSENFLEVSLVRLAKVEELAAVGSKHRILISKSKSVIRHRCCDPFAIGFKLVEFQSFTVHIVHIEVTFLENNIHLPLWQVLYQGSLRAQCCNYRSATVRG